MSPTLRSKQRMHSEPATSTAGTAPPAAAAVGFLAPQLSIWMSAAVDACRPYLRWCRRIAVIARTVCQVDNTPFACADSFAVSLAEQSAATHSTKFSTDSTGISSASHLIRAGPLSLNLPCPAALGEPATCPGWSSALRCNRALRSSPARPPPPMTAPSRRQAITCGKRQRDHSGSTPASVFRLQLT